MKELSQNPYKALSDLRKEFQPVKITKGDNNTPVGWIRISAQGKFKGNWTYDLGLFWVSIVTLKQHDEGKYGVLFNIGNLDDGLWQAFSAPRFKTNNEAFQFCNEFKDNTLIDLNILPSEEELNETLRKVGLFGQFTG